MVKNSMNSKETQQSIRGDLITLGQLIKLLNLISSGAEVKEFLADHRILVNDEAENRRGRKLHPGDLVTIGGVGAFRLISAD